MKLRLRSLVLLAALGALLGCQRELEYDRPGPEYFPVEAGRWRIYQVVDTGFTSQSTSENPYGLELDLDPHYVRHRQGETEQDQMGRTLTRLYTYRTPDTTSFADAAFTFDELWTAHLNDDFAERIEANIRFLVLALPVRANRAWDGNAFNIRGSGPDQQNYRYVTTDTTVTLHGHTYNNCVVVQQRNSETLLFVVDTYEIYAPGVGLIKRYDRNILYDDITLTSITTDSYIRIMTLVAHN